MIRFPAHSIGNTIPCPYCRQQTELTLAAPVQEPVVPRRLVILGIVTLVILVLGTAGVLIALKRAENWAAQKHATQQGSSTTSNTANEPESRSR
jgi:hypothetical protein